MKQVLDSWNPYLRQDIDTLERIQRRARKMIKKTGKINIRRKIIEMWINKFGKEKNKGRPNRSIQDDDWKRSNIATQVLQSQYGKQN